MLFVVATRQHIPRGSDDASRPKAETRKSLYPTQEREACGAVQMVGAIGCLMVARIALVGRHKRIAMVEIVELRGLENHARST